MNKQVQTLTPLPAKSDEMRGFTKLCESPDEGRKAVTPLDAGLRKSLADIESEIRMPTDRKAFPRLLNASEKEELEQSREALLSGLASSRFLRGKLLSEYREWFRGSKLWMQASRAIAEREGIHRNTIDNLIDDYRFAKSVPDSVRSALDDISIDPAAKKNRTVVGAITTRLQYEQKEPDPKRVSQVVTEELVKSHAASRPSAAELFPEFEPLNSEERLQHRIRTAIRDAVDNVSNVRRLEVVIEALEQEMYMVWEQRGQVMLVLKPHRSAITLDGRKLKSDDRTPEVAA